MVEEWRADMKVALVEEWSADVKVALVPGAYETEQLAVEGGIDGGVTQAGERSAAVHQLLAMKGHRVVRV